MAENQILPFAQGASANVQTQTAYAGDVQRLTGNQPGLARSAFVNKTLRQCSAMAAGLAQYIADGQNNTISDANTPPQVAAMLLAANAAQMPSATTGAAGKIRISTTQEAIALTDNTTCLSPYQLVRVFAGRQQLSSPGYFMLPSGVTIQFGQAQAGTDGTGTITYPMAFPANCPYVSVTIGSDTAGIPLVANIYARTLENFSYRVKRADGTAATSLVYWMALGW